VTVPVAVAAALDHPHGRAVVIVAEDTGAAKVLSVIEAATAMACRAP
jgi:NAD(P)H-flavin reductase